MLYIRDKVTQTVDQQIFALYDFIIKKDPKERRKVPIDNRLLQLYTNQSYTNYFGITEKFTAFLDEQHSQESNKKEPIERIPASRTKIPTPQLIGMKRTFSNISK